MGWKQKLDTHDRAYDPGAMTDHEIGQAMDFVERLGEAAGEVAQERVDAFRQLAYDSNAHADAIEKAWSAWDWGTLADLGVIDHQDADVALETLASFS